ncbi:NUDIX hydrolase [Thalassotalea maritima]|uniref:NUDIX hydrolase n=1 Tax=Thalassotalea maritima TaxID=3242416 RepID=UPI003528F5AC
MSQFKPNATIAAIIHCNNKFLLVEEIDNGKRVLNQPAGHMEAGESIVQTFEREVREETGLQLTADSLSGIYYNHRADLDIYYLRFAFVVELAEQVQGTPEDSDIITTHWLSYQEIIDRADEMRSIMVKKCIDDYLTGQRYPLDILKNHL